MTSPRARRIAPGGFAQEPSRYRLPAAECSQQLAQALGGEAHRRLGVRALVVNEAGAADGHVGHRPSLGISGLPRPDHVGTRCELDAPAGDARILDQVPGGGEREDDAVPHGLQRGAPARGGNVVMRAHCGRVRGGLVAPGLPLPSCRPGTSPPAWVSQRRGAAVPPAGLGPDHAARLHTEVLAILYCEHPIHENVVDPVRRAARLLEAGVVLDCGW